MNTEHKYDVFISYASEDREIALKLAEELSAKGLNVWFDETRLKIGDSITEEIGMALRRSRFGILVLSSLYLSKRWPIEEMKALFQLQVSSGQKIILPLWHNIGKEEVMKRFPFLIDIKALSTSRLTMEQIADEICTIAKKVTSEDEPQLRLETGNTQVVFKPPPKTTMDESYLVRTLRPAQMKQTLILSHSWKEG